MNTERYIFRSYVLTDITVTNQKAAREIALLLYSDQLSQERYLTDDLTA